MHKYWSVLFLLFIVSFIGKSFATHNRAGEITYKQISEYTFEFTLITYTYTKSFIDRKQLDFQWGDGTISKGVKREEPPIILAGDYRKSTFIRTHTFPGPGSYEIVVEDPNRNYGVVNIPNSVNTVFSVKTTLTIDPFVGFNNTPILISAPIHKAGVNKLFIHNPIAYDIDGDSLTYKFTPCTAENGEPIDNYKLPKASDSIYINPISGQMIWDSPLKIGKYNVAIGVSEWRNGIRIGTVTRDMQIDVLETNNNPPEIKGLRDFCIIAGEKIYVETTIEDTDKDSIHIKIEGGPFLVNKPARYTVIEEKRGLVKCAIEWETDIEHIRSSPYKIVVTAEDDDAGVPLADMDYFEITVSAPPPENIVAKPKSNTVSLVWEYPIKRNVDRFLIYRSDKYLFRLDTCKGGFGKKSPFQLIGETRSYKEKNFLDNNKGKGLSQGKRYYYSIVALFENRTFSLPSKPIKVTMHPGTPAFINVSVTKIHKTNGEIMIKWIKPRKLDTIPSLGPHKYLIYRSPDMWGQKMILIDSLSKLEDTLYIDKNLNTLSFPYSYTVELYNDEPGNRFLIGFQEIVSSFYPQLAGSDNKILISPIKNSPWIDEKYTIYKKRNDTLTFDSLGSFTSTNHFPDFPLPNKVPFTYMLKSHGEREINGKIYPTINLSHQNTGIAIDTIPPSSPSLYVSSFCDSLYNLISWNFTNSAKETEVISFKIYNRTCTHAPRSLIAKVSANKKWEFKHFPTNQLGQCYEVTAIDSVELESKPSKPICIDICSFYKIPDAITPNNDGKNDFLIAHNPNNYVKKINFKLFNRNGSLIYETKDPNINWDGNNSKQKRVAPGIYYYLCDVYEPRVSCTDEVHNISGFVYVFYSKNDPINIEK